jgi:hypothetical protein
MHPEIRLGKYYEEMIDAITTKNYSADDVIGLMGNMMKEQCFRDGNKRTALLFANTLLLQRNMGYIRIDNKQQYIDTILNYYEDKYNLSQFVQDVKKHFYISSKALEENKELVSQKDLNNFNDEQECLRQDKTSVNKPLKKGIKL